VNKIKIDLRDKEWNGMALIDLTEDRDKGMSLVNLVMNS
jgi:hypothetical protein